MGDLIPFHWTKKQVLQKIQDLHRRNLFPSYGYVLENEPRLLRAAEYRFGPWERALIAAGVICPPFDADSYFDHELCVWSHDPLSEPLNRRGFSPTLKETKDQP